MIQRKSTRVRQRQAREIDDEAYILALGCREENGEHVPSDGPKEERLIETGGGVSVVVRRRCRLRAPKLWVREAARMHNTARRGGMAIEVEPIIGIGLPEAVVAAERHARIDRRIDDCCEEKRHDNPPMNKLLLAVRTPTDGGLDSCTLATRPALRREKRGRLSRLLPKGRVIPGGVGALEGEKRPRFSMWGATATSLHTLSEQVRRFGDLHFRRPRSRRP